MPFVVVGCHRSGTSAVAGILHHLGVNMGINADYADVHNPKGYWEDSAFVLFHEMMLGNWMHPVLMPDKFLDGYKTLIKHREEQKCWGVKDPRLCYILPHFIEFCQSEIKVIDVNRHILTTARSLHRRDGIKISTALDLVEEYIQVKKENLSTFSGPFLSVQFEELLADPVGTIDSIAFFVEKEVSQTVVDFVLQ